jgi:hypothetical protein
LTEPALQAVNLPLDSKSVKIITRSTRLEAALPLLLLSPSKDGSEDLRIPSIQHATQ